MKSIILSAFLFVIYLLPVSAQEKEEEKRGWKPDHLFAGTGLNLGFSNGFIVGLNPEVGYSINQFLDAGIATNLTYVTQRSQIADMSARYLALGAGPFVRIWPARMIFIGGQYEFNDITYKEVTGGNTTYKEKTNANSLLVGLGYGSRMIGESQFFTSIMVDVLNDENSPYRDQYERVLPVFRTGFIFYLGRKGDNR
jgi:opacity protein-like surface antigen